MATGLIIVDKRLVEAFIWEGEALALEYPSGEQVEIPKQSIWKATRPAVRADGEDCRVVQSLSPITRLPIVKFKNQTQEREAHELTS